MKHLSTAHTSTKLTLAKTLLLMLLMMIAGQVWLTCAPLTASQKLVTQTELNAVVEILLCEVESC